jgi:hypothetical protein
VFDDKDEEEDKSTPTKCSLPKQSSDETLMTITTIKWNMNVNLAKMRLIRQKELAISRRSSAAWSVLTTIGTNHVICLLQGSVTA